MRDATQAGRSHLFLVVLFLLFTCSAVIYTRRVTWLGAIPLAAFIFHPSWWISASRGDCGETLVSAALTFSIVTAIAFIANLISLRSWFQAGR